ncbi:hypothetical protein RQP46_000129 [Phenoliferia psychrophenolica]
MMDLFADCSNGTCHKNGWKTHKKQCKEHSQGEENILVNPGLSGRQQAVDEFTLGILPDLCKFLCVPFLDGLLDGPATPYPLHIILEYKPSSLPLRQQFQIAAVNPTSKDLFLQWLTEVLNDSTTLVRSAALWDEEEADEARKLVSASFSESGRSPLRIRLVFSAYKFTAPKAGVAAQPGAVMVHHAMHFAVPTASIHSLAVETLHHILELTVEPYDIRADYHWIHPEPKRRYPTLKACALVCRDWRAPACKLLWRHVGFNRNSHFQAWLDSRVHGTYPTDSLDLIGDDMSHGGDEIHGIELVAAVELGKLAGLKSLLLSHFRTGGAGIPANIWSNKGLADFIGHIKKPSFQLVTFAVQLQAPALFQALFRASAATLISLRSESHMEYALAFNLHHLKALETITLKGIEDPEDIFPTFTTLPSLRRLIIEGGIPRPSVDQLALLFNSIAVPLEELIVRSPTPVWRTAIDRARADGSVSVASLQRVELWNESEFSPDWVTDLENSGIEVVIMKSDRNGGYEVRRSAPVSV